MLLSRLTRQQAALRSYRPSASSQCPHSPKSSRRRIHHVPKLSHDDHFKEHGIGSMLSPDGYDLAWTQYQGFLVDQLNRMTASTKNADRPTRDLLLSTARTPSQATLFNHASMAWNTHHAMTTLTPTPEPMSPLLAQKLSTSFSSPASFKETFLATAAAMFGPGFVWLLKSNTARESNSANDPQLSILCTYIAGSPLPGAHYRRQDVDMNTQSASSLAELRPSSRAGSFGAASGSLDSRIAMGGASTEVLLGVCTWQHFWLRDWGVAGKRDYLEAWWESVDWGVVERNGIFDEPAVRRAGEGLPGRLGRKFL